ncbi:hypothetical protein [Nannocystis pusilla]|uniref:hypothetical protein n=1 Tax=Nannocystis pusilla TaxID=889268 RepID=UPI003B778132
MARLELTRSVKRALARRMAGNDVPRWRDLINRFYADLPYQRAVLDFFWGLWGTTPLPAEDQPMPTSEEHGACCKSCAVGRACEKTCSMHEHPKPAPLLSDVLGPRVLRDFGTVKLVMLPGTLLREDGATERDLPKLQVATGSGEFLFQLSRHEGRLRLSARGDRLSFPHSPGTSFRVFAEDARRGEIGEGDFSKLPHQHVTRRDDRAVTRAQHVHAGELVDTALALARPLLHVLQEAYEWVEAEARVEEIDAALARMTEERRALQAKLGGHRPW